MVRIYPRQTERHHHFCWDGIYKNCTYYIHVNDVYLCGYIHKQASKIHMKYVRQAHTCSHFT